MKKFYSFLLVISVCTSLQAQVTVALIDSVASCGTPCNGSLTFLASGGNGPYTYSLQPGNFSNTSGFFDSLCNGTYTMVVTDQNNNTASLVDSVHAIPGVTITTYTIIPFGPPSHYQVTLNYVGGNAPYYVNWNTWPISTLIRRDTVMSLNDTISGLVPGDYEVDVTDSTNASSGCGNGPNGNPFIFSICDASSGGGIITSNTPDTVCTGTLINITYNYGTNYTPNFPLQTFFASDNPNCDPSASFGNFTCNITQTTTFSGGFFYSMNCPPVFFPPLTITVIPCTGVAENNISENTISISPNPGNDVFTFNSSENSLLTVTIYDGAGRNCFAEIIKSGDQVSPHLSPGIYFCQVKTEKGLVTKKLVVNWN